MKESNYYLLLMNIIIILNLGLYFFFPYKLIFLEQAPLTKFIVGIGLTIEGAFYFIRYKESKKSEDKDVK